MNLGIIRYLLGWVMQIEGAFLLLPCIVSIIYRESEGYAFLLVATVLCLLGGSLILKKPKSREIYAREGFVTVALSWIIISIAGAIPFYLTKEIPSFTDALFESVSGFTTTGSSILTDVEALSHCSLFWRNLTIWIGGMGVLVFLLALIPLAGGQNMQLMKAESPGPMVGKLVPKLRNTAAALYGIYIIISILEVLFLIAGDMPIFDAITITFATVGTGGFTITNAGIASYSPYSQTVISVFMMLSGMNFSLYFLLLARKFKQALHIEEVWLYVGIIAISTAVIAFNTLSFYPHAGEAMHHAFFQVSSIMTSTGFSTVDFNKWPELSKTILIILMFIGACAGSTGGGFKVSRVIILLKQAKSNLLTLIHPHSVHIVKMDDRRLKDETLTGVNVYLTIYVILFFLSLILLSLNGFDFLTNFSAAATTFNNIGPGLNLVGPTANFSIFNNLSKYVLIFNMLAGRLELFPLLVLFAPTTWRRG